MERKSVSMPEKFRSEAYTDMCERMYRMYRFGISFELYMSIVGRNADFNFKRKIVRREVLYGRRSCTLRGERI